MVILTHLFMFCGTKNIQLILFKIMKTYSIVPLSLSTLLGFFFIVDFPGLFLWFLFFIINFDFIFKSVCNICHLYFLFYILNIVLLLASKYNESLFWMIFSASRKNLFWFYHYKTFFTINWLFNNFFAIMLILFQIDSYFFSNFLSLITKDIYCFFSTLLRYYSFVEM